MGKTTINWQFSIAMLVHQRVVSSCAKEINWLHMMSKQSRTEVEKKHSFKHFILKTYSQLLTYLNHHPYNNNPKNLINL